MTTLRAIAFLSIAILAACGDSTGKEKIEEKVPGDDEIERDLPAEYCALHDQCYPGDYQSVSECELDIAGEIEELEPLAPGCSEAGRKYFACLSELEGCDALDAYYDEIPAASYPCREEELLLEHACDPIENATLEDRELARAVCALEYGCYPEDYASASQCEEEILEEIVLSREESQSCGRATLSLYECVQGLSGCEELDRYWDGLPGETGYPCAAEENFIVEACD